MKIFHIVIILSFKPCQAFFLHKILDFLCDIPFLDLILPCPREIEPTILSTISPTPAPTPAPKPLSTAQPTLSSTVEPTPAPTSQITTSSPTAEPTVSPTAEPTVSPTGEPTVSPTAEPTLTPTAQPTTEPTTSPTRPPAPPLQLQLFETIDLPTLPISLGLDRSMDPPTFWTYNAQGTNIVEFNTDGNPLSMFDSQGPVTDSADIEIYDGPLGINGTTLAAGTKHILYMNGGTSQPFINAFTPDGTLVAQVRLQGSNGRDSSVGFAYHPSRATFFLIAWITESVVEIDAETGMVLNRFSLPVAFDIFFGDISVDPATGNLLVISSQESQILEVAPDGDFIRLIDLPNELTAGDTPIPLAGMSVACGELWLASRSGEIYRTGTLENMEPECT